MRVDILHQFLEEFERDARNIGQQRLVERIQSIRASTDPLDYLRKLLAKKHGVSNFQDSSRRTWFSTFVSSEGERLSNKDIDSLVSITKGWELNDTQVNDLRIATRLWTKKPGFFWFGQEHQDILLQTLENLNRIKDVDPMKRKIWLIIMSEFMEKLQHASPPTQIRISNSDPYGKRVRTGITKSVRQFVQNRWPDFSDDQKLKLAQDLVRYSNKGWKYRRLEKPSIVLSLNGANVLRFEDKAWTGLLFVALNAWIEETPQFTIIGELDTAYEAVVDFYICMVVTPRASITNNFESFPRHVEAIRPHGHKRPRQDEDAAVSRRYRPSSAHVDTGAVRSDLSNCVELYSPLFVSQNSLLRQPHNNIERDGNNNESQSHVPNEESEHQPTTGASVSEVQFASTEAEPDAECSIPQTNTPGQNQSTRTHKRSLGNSHNAPGSKRRRVGACTTGTGAAALTTCGANKNGEDEEEDDSRFNPPQSSSQSISADDRSARASIVPEMITHGSGAAHTEYVTTLSASRSEQPLSSLPILESRGRNGLRQTELDDELFCDVGGYDNTVEVSLSNSSGATHRVDDGTTHVAQIHAHMSNDCNSALRTITAEESVAYLDDEFSNASSHTTDSSKTLRDQRRISVVSDTPVEMTRSSMNTGHAQPLHSLSQGDTYVPLVAAGCASEIGVSSDDLLEANNDTVNDTEQSTSVQTHVGAFESDQECHPDYNTHDYTQFNLDTFNFLDYDYTQFNLDTFSFQDDDSTQMQTPIAQIQN